MCTNKSKVAKLQEEQAFPKWASNIGWFYVWIQFFMLEEGDQRKWEDYLCSEKEKPPKLLMKLCDEY